MILAATLVAGALGALVRFVLDSEIKARVGHPFPVGTFVINVSGSFLLGVLAGLVLFSGAPTTWQTIAGTGFCGGYTTFSTASVETVRLIQQGRHRIAALNAAVSALASVGACAAGLAVVWAL